jgi:sulfatase modifying factor 1
MGSVAFTHSNQMKPRTLPPIGALWFAAFALTTPTHAQPLLSVETVLVGDLNNPADTVVMLQDGTSGYGTVAYEYRIGKYELSLSQYTAFLNTVAAADPYSLYNTEMASNLNVAGISRSGISGSYNYSLIGGGNRPVTHVSWFDAARFANWMHNGATNGASTETGAYTLNGATSGIILRNPDAIWWIPSEDEWYKAAYYDPSPSGPTDSYWLYPTRSDSEPGNAIGAAANQANFYADAYSVTQQSGSPAPDQNYLTQLGAFSNSGSYYDTYDQGGNVWEWNDAVIDWARGIRGGSWIDGHSSMQTPDRHPFYAPTDEGNNVGFRVATVPEPSTYALLTMSAFGALWWATRRK